MINPIAPQEFDEKESLVKVTASSAGYHSKFTPPTRVHGIRESADFALACLASSDPADHARGRKILERILSLQVTDPTDMHYGIWGWYAEEPPPQMAPADWNWADFIGVRLLEILHDYQERLTPKLTEEARLAIGHAARSIFRRNIGPGYTNICVMGAVACLAAGEILPDRSLFDYGLRRLHNLRRDLQHHGGFSEYNSPTYTLVVIEELERLLHLVRNPDARADAEALLASTWQLLAEQFHPATGQWAGPQSRTYQNWLDAGKARFLETRTGCRIPVRSSSDVLAFGDLTANRHSFACPEALRARFVKLPASPHQHRHCWLKYPDGTPARVSTTWFTDEATLGTLNRDSTWVQRRILLGYWRTSEDPAVRVRLRLLHNGNDFSAGFVWNHQEGPRVLSGFHFVTGEGDFHPILDLPADNTFRTRDLRIRYEIEGIGATVKRLAPDLFELSAGSHKIVIRTGPLRFEGRLTQGWSCGTENQTAFVDGEFYSGPERPFHPGKADECTAAAALELLPEDQPFSSHPIHESEKDGQRFFRWQADQGYEVRVPLVAGKKLV